jgi:hypothetical protein
LRHELRAIVQADVLRHAALEHQLCQNLDHFRRGQTASRSSLSVRSSLYRAPATNFTIALEEPPSDKDGGSLLCAVRLFAEELAETTCSTRVRAFPDALVALSWPRTAAAFGPAARCRMAVRAPSSSTTSVASLLPGETPA